MKNRHWESFQYQKYAIHDGAGIRTTVFFNSLEKKHPDHPLVAVFIV